MSLTTASTVPIGHRWTLCAILIRSIRYYETYLSFLSSANRDDREGAPRLSAAHTGEFPAAREFPIRRDTYPPGSAHPSYINSLTSIKYNLNATSVARLRMRDQFVEWHLYSIATRPRTFPPRGIHIFRDLARMRVYVRSVRWTLASLIVRRRENGLSINI